MNDNSFVALTAPGVPGLMPYVPGKPISLCAFISDDVQIGAARVHFKRPKDKFSCFF